MAKKKREHVVFDQMLKQKRQIPFGKVNQQTFTANRSSKRSFTRRENMGGSIH